MPAREDLVEIIADYREGEVPRATVEMVDRWSSQFPEAVRDAVVAGIAHVFRRTYISRDRFRQFLTGLATSGQLASGTAPDAYWRRSHLLNIQQGGHSQADILALFDPVLQQTHGFGVDDTGADGGDYIYLDDCIGTGSRVRSDLRAWIENAAPQRAHVQIIAAIRYAGSYWIDAKIQEAATAAGKTITTKTWWLDGFAMENRLAYRNDSDVLWPAAIPDEPAVAGYVAKLVEAGHPPVLRGGNAVGSSGLFANSEQRIALEQAMLVRGCQLRLENPRLPDKARPIGYHNLDCFGFGSMFVTYRNCPNNCPLAFWVQQHDVPSLLPRKIN